MKKSKIVTIGLLALSIAACHRKKESKYQSWDQFQNSQNTPNYYINDGTGYHQGGISLIWIYWAYVMGSNNSIRYEPGYIYRSYGRYGTGSYHTTEFGSRSTIARSSVSRGGFGGSSSHVSA